MNPRTGSPRAQLPPCYYEGYLEKRGPKEKVSGSGVSLCYCMMYQACLIHHNANAVRGGAWLVYCVDTGEVCIDQLSCLITLERQVTQGTHFECTFDQFVYF